MSLPATTAHDAGSDQAEVVPIERAPGEMTLVEAMELGVRYQRAGQLDVAEAIYLRVLEACPDLPDGIQFLGVLKHQRGASDEAVQLIRKAIALAPERATYLNNLGNVLFETRRWDEAAQAYEQSIALAAANADVYNNLGVARRALGRTAEAVCAYEKAIELDPRHADAYHNMGNLLTGIGRIKESVEFFCTSITLRPRQPETKRLLGLAYANLGRMDEARQVYREWLDEEPGDPIAKHMLAACGSDEVPARASDGFVESVFDSFAASFDTKLERLRYRAPQLVADEVARWCGAPQRTLRIADAGCGTGLCGPLVAPFAAHLAGVDLSTQMLARARERGVYDDLTHGELSSFLRANPDSFDVIVCADTLCYFGALDEPIQAACAALRAGGMFVFTVEKFTGPPTDGSGYHLGAHGRYSHTEPYVEARLAAAGLEAVSIHTETLRMESGSAVAGLVVAARRTAER
jgi:predicted TPR repeat methyltransferase